MISGRETALFIVCAAGLVGSGCAEMRRKVRRTHHKRGISRHELWITLRDRTDCATGRVLMRMENAQDRAVSGVDVA